MNKLKRKLFQAEGLTLVEVLASIVILSIVITIFLAVFAQTAKTNKVSEEIVDATYLAQQIMEEIYELSLTVKKENRKEELEKEGYLPDQENDDETYIKYEDGHSIQITFKKRNDLEDVEDVIVEILDRSDEDEKPKAIMQNMFEWSANDEE